MSDALSDDDHELDRSLLDVVREAHPGLARFLVALSLPVRAELELVRAIRHRFFPESPPDLEADLWSSPVLQAADAAAVVLLPEVRRELQAELADDQELLRATWELVEEHHRAMDEVILLEERTAYHSLLQNRHLAQVEIGRVIGSLGQIHDDEERRKLLRWTRGFLPRLPNSIKAAPAARKLRDEVAKHSERPVASGVPTSADVSSTPARSSPRTAALGIRRVANGLSITSPYDSRSLRLEVPGTNPLHLDLAWPTARGWHEAAVQLSPGKRPSPSPPGGAPHPNTSFAPSFIATPPGQLRLRDVDEREFRLRPAGAPPLLFILHDEHSSRLPESVRTELHDLAWNHEMIALDGLQAPVPTVWIGGAEPEEFSFRQLVHEVTELGLTAISPGEEERRDKGYAAALQSAVQTSRSAVLTYDAESLEDSVFRKELDALLRRREADRDFAVVTVPISPHALEALNRHPLRDRILLETSPVRPGPPDRLFAQIRESLAPLEREGAKAPSRSTQQAAATLLLFSDYESLEDYASRLAPPAPTLIAEAMREPASLFLCVAPESDHRATEIAPFTAESAQVASLEATLAHALLHSELSDPAEIAPADSVRGCLVKAERRREAKRIDGMLAKQFRITPAEVRTIEEARVVVGGQAGFLAGDGLAIVFSPSRPPETIEEVWAERSFKAVLRRFDESLQLAVYEFTDGFEEGRFLPLRIDLVEREARWSTIILSGAERPLPLAGLVRHTDVRKEPGASRALALRLPRPLEPSDDFSAFGPVVIAGELVGVITRILPGADPGGEGDLAYATDSGLLHLLLGRPNRLELVEWSRHRPEGVWGPPAEEIDGPQSKTERVPEPYLRWAVASPDGSGYQLLHRQDTSRHGAVDHFPPNDFTAELHKLLPENVHVGEFLKSPVELSASQALRIQHYAHSIADMSGPALPGLRHRLAGTDS